MKRIGKGTFTTAWLKENGKVKLLSVDPVKECMALGWFPDHRLFPQIERIDYGVGPSGEHSEYEMDFYERPRSLKNSLDPREYRLYRALYKVRGIDYGMNEWESLAGIHSFFDDIPDEFEEERKALKDAADACGNYGPDVRFEISPRNVAVKDGKLILLDCFFMGSALRKAYA